MQRVAGEGLDTDNLHARLIPRGNTADEAATANGDEQRTVNKNQTVKVDADQKVNVGRTIVVEAGTSSELKVGGSSVKIEPAKITMKSAQIAIEEGQGSVSRLQRRLSVGHARAGKLMDMLEAMGIVSKHQGSKPREVLITEADLPEYFGR